MRSLFKREKVLPSGGRKKDFVQKKLWFEYWVRMAILRSFFLSEGHFSLQWCWHILDVRLGLGQDGWGSLLTQMAGTKAKHRA